jgi:copper transport protein
VSCVALHHDSQLGSIAPYCSDCPDARRGRGPPSPTGAVLVSWRVMKRALALTALVVVAIVVTAGPAFAHATAVSFSPAQGARLPAGSPPRVLSVGFDEGVQIPPNALQMFDSTGKQVQLGPATHSNGEASMGATVPKIADGTYVVTWRAVSDDAHPVSGSWTFSVGTPSKSTVDVASLTPHGDRPLGVVFGIGRALAFLSLLVLVGGIAFVRTWWPDAASRRPIIVLFVVAWATVIITALAGIGLEAAYSTGKGFGSVLDWNLIKEVMRSHFGEAWLTRAIVAAACLPFVLRPTLWKKPWPRGAVLDVGLVLVGLLLLATISYAGHATTGRWVALAFVTDVLHLTGAAGWLGGLVVIALALWLPARARGAPLASARFSRLAGPAIALIVLTGTVQAFRQVSSLSALVHTTYGRLLIAKVLAVGVVLVAASASRDIVRERVLPALTPALGPGAARAEADDHDVRNLRDAVVVEVVLAIIIVALTAVLVNTEPARAASTGGSFSTTVKNSAMWFDVSVSPAKAGTNNIRIVPRVPNGGAASLLDMTATLANPARKVAPINVLLSTSGPFNTSYAGQSTIPFPGRWTLEIKALRTQVDETDVTVTVPVS